MVKKNTSSMHVFPSFLADTPSVSKLVRLHCPCIGDVSSTHKPISNRPANGQRLENELLSLPSGYD